MALRIRVYSEVLYFDEVNSLDLFSGYSSVSILLTLTVGLNI